ncbi:MAG: hypothetical protein PHH91_11615 [Desulfuromonadaceae bacterium]|nr:hypothetical protein [Desulfuromonadaceae bacterium]
MINDDYLLLKEVVDILPCSIERIRILISDGVLPVYVNTCEFKNSADFVAIGKYCRALQPLKYFSEYSENLCFSQFEVFNKEGKVLGNTSGIYMLPESHSSIRFKKDDVVKLMLQFELDTNETANAQCLLTAELTPELSEQLQNDNAQCLQTVEVMPVLTEQMEINDIDAGEQSTQVTKYFEGPIKRQNGKIGLLTEEWQQKLDNFIKEYRGNKSDGEINSILFEYGFTNNEIGKALGSTYRDGSNALAMTISRERKAYLEKVSNLTD